MTPRPRRGFVGVGARRVHFRLLGDGAPVVLLHGSPGDSEMLGHEMAALAAAGHTCIALDTPGFGFSDALPGEVLTVPELAAATAAAMAALALPPCPVFGTHTGAAIGLELGVGFSDRVSALVLEGLPMFTQAEIDALFQGYFEPLVVDPLGSHLFATWMRFRDQFTWFPWHSRDVTRLNPVDRPDPAAIDQWVSMYYRSAKTYRPAYRAACFYGPAARPAVEALTLPAVFLASAEDMLFPHLDRLPPLRSGQRIERLAHDPAAKMRAIVAAVARLPQAPADTGWQRPGAAAGTEPQLQFVDTGAGEVFLRRFGDPRYPPLLLLHDAPGSGALHLDLARELACSFHVLLPDLPGCGESSQPADPARVVETAGDAVLAVLRHVGINATGDADIKHCAVVGIGCGAAVAASLAGRAGTAVSQVLLIDPPHPDEATAQSIAPTLTLAADGGHWLQAWMRVRDGQVSNPWFDGRIAAQRTDQGRFDGDWLHDQTCALMASRETFHLLPQAAWRFDLSAAQANALVPITTLHGKDPVAAICHHLLDTGEPA